MFIYLLHLSFIVTYHQFFLPHNAVNLLNGNIPLGLLVMWFR